MDCDYIYKKANLIDFRLKLPEKICSLLERENINTIEKVLTCSNIKLESIGMTADEIKQLKCTISKEYFNKYLTASECSVQMESKWKRLSFGCTALDNVTKNGLLNRGINEISGESSSGKSQICLQLSLMVQLSETSGGFGKGAVFICTEDAFPSKRLAQMANTYTQRYGDRNFLDNIFIEHINDSEKLLNCILVRLPQLLQQHAIGLIVIDSVAGVFRIDTNMVTRANDMRKLVHGLQSISNEFGCVVVCINQVTSVVDNKSENKLIPCLGLAWSNLVTTRIQIQKTDDNYVTQSTNRNGKTVENSLTIRKFDITFSPELPQASASFLITENGVVDVPQ